MNTSVFTQVEVDLIAELVSHPGYPTLAVARTAKGIMAKLGIESILVQFDREESFCVIGLDSPKMLCSHKVIEDVG